MNIASQTQSFLQGFIAEQDLSKWIEPLNSKYLPTVIVALLTLVLASQAADLTWRLIPVPESALISPQRTPPPAAEPSPKGAAENGLQSVANLHLFGKAGVKPVTKIEAKAPETRLNLTLHGVFVDENPEQGAAIIGTSGSKQKYYKVGASVMSGVTLQGVFSDRVVLLRNNRSEVLRFPKVPSSAALVQGAKGSPASSQRREPAGGSNALQEYREVFQKEPLKIFEHVRFVPVRSREGLKGYRVLPQKNRELYNKLGIRPSDLVTAVNGISLQNDQEAMKLMQTLQDTSSLQVDIVRNGQPQSLTFDLN
jgi:general secretion pathway protein C